MTKAAAWLDAKFVEWRSTQTSRRAPVEKFADSIGIERFDFYNVMKGQGLSAEKVAKIAKALADDSAFEAFDVPRPNPLRWALEKLFDTLTDEEKQNVLDNVDEYKKSKRRGGKPEAEPKKRAS